LDLYLIHWPVAFQHNSGQFYSKDVNGNPMLVDIPLGQTYAAMESLIDKGLVRSLGVSNFSISQYQEVSRGSRHKPVTNQIECHPYFNQNEMRAFLNKDHSVLTAYSPLGSVPAPHTQSSSPIHIIKDPVVEEISKETGKTSAQVLIRWSLQKGNVCIPKSSNPDRIEENIKVWDFDLSREQMTRLDKLSEHPKRFVNPSVFRSPPRPFFD